MQKTNDPMNEDSMTAEEGSNITVEQLLSEHVDDRITDLRASLTRAHSAIDKLKERREWMRQELWNAATENMNALQIPRVPTPGKLRAGPGDPEIAVAMLSDFQLGKKTPNYNFEICERRVEYLAKKTIRITDVQRADHPVKNLQVWLLGDMVEGELIFPNQAHQIDASLFRQVMVHAPRIIMNYLRTMLTNFAQVDIYCVIGNHGRIGGMSSKQHHPETNADLFLYEFMKESMASEKRLVWHMPDYAEDGLHGEALWYQVAQAGAYSCLLVHGDQIRGHSSFPWYGLSKKVLGWNALANDSRFPMEPFKDVAMGHWHTPTTTYMNGITVRINGTTESYNTFAQMQMAAMGEPSQRVLFVHPERGIVTGEYQVDLSMGQDLAVASTEW